MWWGWGDPLTVFLTQLIACWVNFHALLSSYKALTEGHSHSKLPRPISAKLRGIRPQMYIEDLL